jgi:hypothetical protein
MSVFIAPKCIAHQMGAVGFQWLLIERDAVPIAGLSKLSMVERFGSEALERAQGDISLYCSSRASALASGPISGASVKWARERAARMRDRRHG